MASHCDAQSSPSTGGLAASWVGDSKNNHLCWSRVHSCLKTVCTDENFVGLILLCVFMEGGFLRRLRERYEKTHVEEEDSLKCNLTMKHNLTNRLRLELASAKFSHNEDLKFYRRLLLISLVVIGVLFLLLLPSFYVRGKVVGLCPALTP